LWFGNEVKNSYYYEVYWFPFSNNCWVNAWDKSDDLSGTVDSPGLIEAEMQNFESYLSEISNSTVFPLLPPSLQIKLTTSLAEKMMMNSPKKVWHIDALHFRRGIQNMRVLNFEYLLAIPCSKDSNEPDFTVVQRLWWDSIQLVRDKAEKDKDYPLRLLLQMKFVANSNILMAPSHNNPWGTCIIEVVSPILVPNESWTKFKQDLSDLWMSYGVRCRPHWAKEWQNIKINGGSVEDHIKSAYAEEIPVFKKTISEIGQHGGCSAEQMKMFAPANLRKIFY